MSKCYIYTLLAIFMLLPQKTIGAGLQTEKGIDSEMIYGQTTINVVIDPRVELMSVIFRLADNIEYNQCKSKKIDKSIKNYFFKYKDHPAIKKAKELRKRHHIGYDAVMSLAVHLKNIETCEGIIPFDARPATLDSRWKMDELKVFLNKCHHFVQETQFENFLAQNKEYYNKSCKRLQKIVDEKIKLEWFSNYFGDTSNVRFNLILSIINGTSNYASRIHVNEKSDIYCILGANDIEWLGNGLPKFDQTEVSLIVHEYCHSFCNPIVNKNMDKLSFFGKKFYKKHKKDMENQAYGNWQAVMRETLVRACEVRYANFIDGCKGAKKVIHYQVSRSFVYTKELSEVLAKYENQKANYLNFESFFPEIIIFFNETAFLPVSN